jgi:hypothetical protein
MSLARYPDITRHVGRERQQRARASTDRDLVAAGALASQDEILVLDRNQARPVNCCRARREAGEPVGLPELVLAAHGALADDVDVDSAAATIYALVNESVYLRLADGFGWTPDQYRDWLARTLVGALLAPAAP